MTRCSIHTTPSRWPNDRTQLLYEGADMTRLKWLERAPMTAWVVAALALLPAMTGCAREPEPTNLSAITYNYSDEDIAFVWVNGKEAGVAKEAVKPGDVNGGGVMCCIKLIPGQRQVDVRVQTADDIYYTATAQIEQPWTKYATYAIVHMLPKRKIIVEIAPGFSFPRKDLLDQRLSELGIKPEAAYPADMMNLGPSVDLE